MLTNQLDKVNHSHNLNGSFDSDVDTIGIDEKEIKTEMLTSKCAFALHCDILHQLYA